MSYDKHMETMGLFQDIYILKVGNSGPLMASTMPYQGYNFDKDFLKILFDGKIVFSQPYGPWGGGLSVP